MDTNYKTTIKKVFFSCFKGKTLTYFALLTLGLVCPISVFCSFEEKIEHVVEPILPGRVGSGGIYYTKIGESFLFFYMTESKRALMQQYIRDINEKVMLTFDNGPLSNVKIVCPVAKKGEPLFNLHQTSMPGDDGRSVLDQYLANSKECIEQVFQTQLLAMTDSLQLIVNQDALKYQKISSDFQCKKLKEEGLNPADYYFFEDNILADWQMAQGTLSAMVVQDNPLGDRYLIFLMPKEVVGTAVAQAFSDPLFFNGKSNNEYFPYRTVIAPIEFRGDKTVGSWKGKSINSVLRGLVPKSDIMRICENSTYINLNQRLEGLDENGNKEITYSNGIALKTLPFLQHKKSNGFIFHRGDAENISLLQENATDYEELNALLCGAFGVHGKICEVYTLIKKDGGFSLLDKLPIEIPHDASVIVINKSHLPEGYKPYMLSENCFEVDKPWIQLYHFPLQMAMKIPGHVWPKLSLTPIEEILYRDETRDSQDRLDWQIRDKIVCEMQIFIIKKCENE